MKTFVAIDFETADYRRDSACAVGAVLVENGRIAGRHYRLIRPPRKKFFFTRIHGLRWSDVRDSPTFPEIWPDLRDLIKQADFLVAHSASFDQGVLHACCDAAKIARPTREFRCTVKMSRAKWKNLPSTKLPVVCDHLRIPLDHHNALSDAEACAKIAIKALR